MSSAISLLMFSIVIQHRWRLLIMSVIGLALASAYFLLAEKMYTAELTVVPVSHEQSLAAKLGLGGAVAGLGSIAGFSSSSQEDSRESLAVLRSRILLQEFIAEENLLPVLFEDKWDKNEGAWKDSVEAPSIWDGYQYLSSRVVSVTEYLAQGVVKIQITWRDPATAANWANALIALANERIRDRAIAEANASIEFLRNELDRTSVLEVRQGIFSLIEAQVRQRMLANTRPDYAFKIVDPALDKDLDSYDYPKAAIVLPVGMLVLPAVYLLVLLSGIVFSGNSKSSKSQTSAGEG